MKFNFKQADLAGKQLPVLAGIILVLIIILTASAWVRYRNIPVVEESTTNSSSVSVSNQVQAAVPTQPTETFETITLAKHANAMMEMRNDVPNGLTVCQDVPFECKGAIRLGGLRASRDGKQYAGAVVGVPVSKCGSTLHVLQAAENWTGSVRGTPYGKILLHYANGESRSLYLRFLIHGMDWFGGPRTMEETVADPNTRLGWFFQKMDGTYRRFFHTVFANPLPEVEIASVDFIAPMDLPNLWVFGFTVGNNADMLIHGGTEPPPLQRTTVALKVVTPEGQPATNASVIWQAVASGGFIKFPPFRVDNQGVVILDLPARGIDLVDYMASTPPGLGCVGILQPDGQGMFPDSLEIKLVAGGATGLPELKRIKRLSDPPAIRLQPEQMRPPR